MDRRREEGRMRHLATILVLLAACGVQGDRLRQPLPPEPVDYAFLTIDGQAVWFTQVCHMYDDAQDRTVIEMGESQPADWWAILQGPGDAPPVEAWVFDPEGGVHFGMPTVTIREWATGAGWTEGAVDGFVGTLSVDGEFVARRGR
jgi:hypothetical protein